MRGSQSPPRLAEAFLRLVVPPGVVGESIVGDAREEYAEHVRSGGWMPVLWYWTHVARLAGGYVVTRGGDVEMGSILKDFKFGARSLMRMPGSAAVAVVVLAIGIGLCSFMFSLLYGVYFRGLDLPTADRLLKIHETRVEQNQLQRGVPIQNFADWRERQTSFDALLANYGGTVNVAGADEAIRLQGSFTTANTFSLLGVEPFLGRGFAVGDDAPGAPLNIVLGYGVWRDQYGSDRSVVGQDVRVNGETGVVLGVMPEGFDFPNSVEAWVPLRDDPLATPRGQGGRYLNVYGLLREGMTRDQATLDMARISQQLQEEHPDFNDGIGSRLYTPTEANLGPEINMVFGAMMFAVICVLLVACANVASLLLARASMRTKEAGVRVAMGGSRFRVMLPFFAESVVLAMAGAAIGVGIAWIGVGWFDEVTSPATTGRPSFMKFTIDLPILLFVVGTALVTALIAGIAPALQMSRTDVNTVLKDEARGSSGLLVARLTRGLVITEVALSVTLLVAAGLMTKSIVQLGSTEYPFETDALFTARVGLFPSEYPDVADRRQFWSDLSEELSLIPEATASGLSEYLPYDGRNELPVAVVGETYDQPTDRPVMNRALVTPGYFAALGVTVGGRDFSDADGVEGERVAIVNQPLADRLFGGANPMGQQFREGDDETVPPLTIVGVVPDLHMTGMQMGNDDSDPAGYYVPLAQDDRQFMSIAVLTRSGNAAAVTGDVRAAVRRLDPSTPIYEVYSQAEVIDRQTWFFRVFGVVFIVFGAAALFMATVGLYGVLSFAVSRRTQEMGIRMALGAASRDVVGLVARQGAVQLGVGLAIGLALAFGVTRGLSFILFQVDSQDPTVFASVMALIVIVGMSAVIVPARRATSVNPVRALRAE